MDVVDLLFFITVIFIIFAGMIIILHYFIVEFDRLQVVLYKMSLNIVMVWKAGRDAQLEIKEKSFLLEDGREFRNHQLDYWQTLARKAIKSHRGSLM